VTKGNLPNDNAGGVEFGVNGKLTSKLAYNLSADVFYNEIDATPFGASGIKSDVSGSGKASFDYKPTKSDTWQLSVNYTGEQLTAQGWNSALTLVNAGYKHKFTGALSGVVTASDLFNAQRQTRRFDAPDLRDESERRQEGPTVFVGLVYTFGGKSKTKDNFNYDNSGDRD
jgi:hypothetical protein